MECYMTTNISNFSGIPSSGFGPSTGSINFGAYKPVDTGRPGIYNPVNTGRTSPGGSSPSRPNPPSRPAPKQRVSRLGNNINNFSSSVSNSLNVDVYATGGSSVTVNVNQTTTINNTPTIQPPATIAAQRSYVSPVYRGSNFVKPLDVTLNANLGTIINKR